MAMIPSAATTPAGVWRGAWLLLALLPPCPVPHHFISAPLVQRVEESVLPAQTRTQKTDGVTLHWLNTGGQCLLASSNYYKLVVLGYCENIVDAKRLIVIVVNGWISAT